MGLNEAMLVVVSILEGKFDYNKPFHFDLHNMPVIIGKYWSFSCTVCVAY